MKPKSNLDDFCKTRAFSKDQPKCKTRFTPYTQLGIEAGNSLRGDYFIKLLELVESRVDNELPNYQMALDVAQYYNRLGINHLPEQIRFSNRVL